MNEVMDRYLATWNAPSVQERARLLAAHWGPEATYTDPLAQVAGHGELDATIGAVRQQFPGWVFTALGPADAHHRQLRFTWGLGPAGGEPAVVGFDVVVVDEVGLIQDVRGFLDTVPT